MMTGRELCHALGIDSSDVMRLVITAEPPDFVVEVTVTRLVRHEDLFLEELHRYTLNLENITVPSGEIAKLRAAREERAKLVIDALERGDAKIAELKDRGQNVPVPCLDCGEVKKWLQPDGRCNECHWIAVGPDFNQVIVRNDYPPLRGDCGDRIEHGETYGGGRRLDAPPPPPPIREEWAERGPLYI